MRNSYQSKAVLITGGTKGIGLATGLAFGARGAQVFLTHKWGSADEEELLASFRQVSAPAPKIIEADVSLDEDTDRLLQQIKREHDRLEVFVSNVCVAQVTEGLESFQKRALYKSLEYSAWPLVGYLKRIKEVLGSYPRYVVAVSSDGPDVFYGNYEYVAIAKTVMEVFCRYLAKRLAGEGVRINAVRTRNVLTESALAVHTKEYPEFFRRFGGESHFLEAKDVGESIFALCSGLMDALSGQVISVDKGGPFEDNLFRLYRNREKFGL
jgi:NAD(P)-dependent dehydrogenase (short-subunit alcohol dehydrogenase family)